MVVSWNMGTSSHHPFLDGISHEINQPAIKGYPHDCGNHGNIKYNPQYMARSIHLWLHCSVEFWDGPRHVFWPLFEDWSQQLQRNGQILSGLNYFNRLWCCKTAASEQKWSDRDFVEMKTFFSRCAVEVPKSVQSWKEKPDKFGYNPHNHGYIHF